MIILIDVDDVVADLMPSWLEQYNNEYNDNLTPDKITTWDISSLVVPDAKNRIYEIINNHRFYYSVQPVVGALEGILSLRKSGHRVIFVTSAMVGHAGDKLRWLQHNRFLDPGKINDDDYIEVADKTLVKGDIIIDDRVKNVLGYVKTGGCAILFSRPWNSELAADDECLFRAADWNEVVRTVEIIVANKVKDTQPLKAIRPSIPPVVKEHILQDGVKFDEDKLKWDLLPWEATGEIVAVMTYGAKKYAPYNWTKGMSWSRVYAAALRHLSAWFNGEDKDKDTGLSHLAHAACCVLFLISYQLWGGKFAERDDRPFREINSRK